jgi:hypothetical protein
MLEGKKPTRYVNFQTQGEVCEGSKSFGTFNDTLRAPRRLLPNSLHDETPAFAIHHVLRRMASSVARLEFVIVGGAFTKLAHRACECGNPVQITSVASWETPLPAYQSRNSLKIAMRTAFGCAGTLACGARLWDPCQATRLAWHFMLARLRFL